MRIWHRRTNESDDDFQDRVANDRRREEFKEQELKLRQKELELKERQIIALESLISPPPKKQRPLGGKARKIAEYITKHPGKIGDVIAEDCGISNGHFHRLFREKLRPAGFINRHDGEGYFPPST